MKFGQTYLPNELVILTKFHENRTKIVDFLLIVTFLASCKFLGTPSRYIFYFSKGLTWPKFKGQMNYTFFKKGLESEQVNLHNVFLKNNAYILPTEFQPYLVISK